MLNQYFIALLVTGITHLVLAIFVFLKGPKKLTNVTYALYSVAISWWSCWEAFSITADTMHSALLLWRINHIGVIFIPIFFVHFVMSLMEDQERLKKRSLILGSYAVGTFLLALNSTDLLIHEVVPKFSFHYFINPGLVYSTFFLGWVAWAVYGLALLFKVYAASTGALRNQLRYFCWSMLIAYAGGAPNFLPTFNIEIPILMPFGTYAIPAYAFVTSYAIVRYRLMDVSLVFTRMALFAVVYAPLLVLPLFLGKLSQPILSSVFGVNWWMIPMVFEALFAVGGLVVYRFIRQRAEERLLAEQRRYQAILRQASQNMTLIKDLNKLLRRTVALLTKEVGLKHIAIYLQDPRSKKFVPKVSRWWKVPSPPMFSAQDALLRYFEFSANPAVTEELQLQVRGSSRQSSDLHQVVASLRALKAAVAVPSFVEKRCIGFLVLGEKASGMHYTPDDLQVFQVLANQAALAVENAIFYEELQRTQADLFQTAKMADLGRMAGGMSHQINNRFHVLTILAGTMKSALKGVDPRALDPEKLQQWWDKVMEAFVKVEDNSLRGGEIVKTLLKFSRPSGEHKPVAWPEMVKTALEVVQHRVDLTRFDLKEQFPEGLASVNGDHNLLADCLFNLISNAYDAMEHKGQLLAQSQLPVQPEDASPYRGRLILKGRPGRAEDGKDWVILEMADNGVGMTPQELECLFFPFFTTKATAEKGTGLGLYVIKRVIEQHGGTISCQSQYGVGTTFTICLPACADVPEPPAAPPPEKPSV